MFVARSHLALPRSAAFFLADKLHGCNRVLCLGVVEHCARASDGAHEGTGALLLADSSGHCVPPSVPCRCGPRPLGLDVGVGGLDKGRVVEIRRSV
jgi:hypothetical protein